MMNTTTINYDEMIMENMGLVYMIFNKYYKTYAENYKEEMEQIGRIALYKAIQSYEEGKGAFSTFASNIIKNDMYTFVTQDINKYKGITDGYVSSFEESCGNDDSDRNLENILGCGEDDFDNLEYSELYDYILTKDERIRTIIEMVIYGYTYQEIGTELGITKQRVGTLIKKLRDDMTKRYEKSSSDIARQIMEYKKN